MNFWLLIVALAISYLAQVGLSFFQMKDFATSYGSLRRRGNLDLRFNFHGQRIADSTVSGSSVLPNQS